MAPGPAGYRRPCGRAGSSSSCATVGRARVSASCREHRTGPAAGTAAHHTLVTETAVGALEAAADSERDRDASSTSASAPLLGRRQYTCLGGRSPQPYATRGTTSRRTVRQHAGGLQVHRVCRRRREHDSRKARMPPIAAAVDPAWRAVLAEEVLARQPSRVEIASRRVRDQLQEWRLLAHAIQPFFAMAPVGVRVSGPGQGTRCATPSELAVHPWVTVATQE